MRNDARYWPEEEIPTLTVAAALIGGAVVGTVGSAMSADAQRSAGNKAADAQVQAAQLGVEEQRRQFDITQKLLSPFVTGGTKGFAAQQDLIGLNGNAAQAKAIAALQASPQFTSALQAGNNNILQNASATGGLRGGNTQAALAQFSPQLLAATINDQYARLGGISSMGLGAATQTGAFGQASANNITGLMQQSGAAQAGAYLNAGQAQANMWGGISNSIGGALGTFAGLGGKF